METKTSQKYSPTITEEEAELYDRQIRLWGPEAQKRISEIKALVIGAKGLGAEISKNLILVGIKSLTLIDDETTHEKDLDSQFFLSKESVNKNRALESLPGLCDLNPHVKVDAYDKSFTSFPTSFFEQFNVIIATNQNPNSMIFINDLCRFYDKKCFCADVFGMFGYCKMDVQRSAKATHVDLKTLLSVDIPSIQVPRKTINNPSYPMFRVYMEFYNAYNRKPFLAGDNERLEAIRNKMVTKWHISEECLPPGCVKVPTEEWGPACTVVGGFVAQDVLRSFYAQDVPNWLKIFDPHSASGVEYSFEQTPNIALYTLRNHHVQEKSSSDDCSYEVIEISPIKNYAKSTQQKRWGEDDVHTEISSQQLQQAIKTFNSSYDDAQCFGNYVASELRQLSSTENKRKMKSMINRVIAHVATKDLHETSLKS